MVTLYSILIGVVAYALHLYNHGSRLTPDGGFYQSMGRGNPAPNPYRLRWFLPRVLGPTVRPWVVTTGLSLVLTCPIIARLGGEHWILAVILWVGLPWFRLCVRYPVLTDAPAMLFALLSVVLLPVNIYLAVVAALLAGACRESAPVYAALFALNPLPLVGLFIPMTLSLLVEKGDIPMGSEWLRKPIKSAWDHHGGKLLDPKWTLLPWGMALLAVFNENFYLVLPAVVVAYGTMLVANDFARLYQWSAPVVVVAAAQVAPEWAIFAVPILHLMNPWADIQV